MSQSNTNTKNTFAYVFSNISFPQHILDVFSDAKVSYVKYMQSEKCLNIGINFNSIINESILPSVESILQLGIKLPKNVKIQPIYDIDYNAEDSLGVFWDNMLYRLGLDSLFIFTHIANATWHFSDNIVNIGLTSESQDILYKMGADKKIEYILFDGLGLQLKIRFFYDEKNAKKVPETSKNRYSDSYKPGTTQKNSPAASIAKKHKQAAIQKIVGEVKPLNHKLFVDEELIVQGEIFNITQRITKNKKIMYTFDIADKLGAVSIRFFLAPEKENDYKNLLKKGQVVKVAGRVKEDTYTNELNIMANKIAKGLQEITIRQDNAKKKRVELHLHTNMSQMDGISSIKDYIARAKAWEHNALAITDHGVVQAYPDAFDAAKKAGIKAIYGIEAYIVDDLEVVIATRASDTKLNSDYVVFDLETTGFNRENCRIIEIGAVKVVNGEIVDTFNQLINPQQKLPKKIIEITNITDDMLTDMPLLPDVLPKFIEFVGDSILVAHNAEFDMGFYEHYSKLVCGFNVQNPYLCTLQLSRALFPKLGRHNLAAISRHLGVSLENHHRACDDAAALSDIFNKCIDILKNGAQQIETLEDINSHFASQIDIKRLKSKHCTILVKNQKGMRNLYELVSKSHLQYFYRYPIMPKSEIIKLKEGLILGTACEAGELFSAVKDNKPVEYIEELAKFYDFFEIMPAAHNMHLIRNGELADIEALQAINRKIIEYGKLYEKPVAATGDVHFIEPEHEVFRRIIQKGNNIKNVENQPPLYFKTTDEMLEDFSYLGQDLAYEVVVTNTNIVADMIEDVYPIPSGTYPPVLKDSDKDLEKIVMKRAKAIYGEVLPKIVADRLDRELGVIIKNGFAVMYIIAQKLVKNSVENGYLVGSRGSIGSSLVATMADITEVNPLQPHYFCESCQYTDFDSDIVKAFLGGSGCDMPNKACPKCSKALKKEGHHIPFETFLGFDGDKEPDIDLNFSGEYQAQAHAYATELFGEGFVFKAGTIGTIAEKTAYGYVRKYLDEQGRVERGAFINRLVAGCTGIKRTTGQHPGGLMIVPHDKSIYDFTPVQRPANDQKSDVITTHFDYHSISGRLLKLDILGHDVPTMIKMLQDMTGIDPKSIDIGDKEVVSLFKSPKRLNLTPEEIRCKTGTLGLPEFGTGFVRQMLIDTQPESFGELVRISGLSHGTNVWLNNGQELIRNKVATLKEIIPTRDDIMVYLINKGVEKLPAFKIMENVRKGKGVTQEEEAIMLAASVPKWYIESCRKIEYMFPKGHAVAYTLMTLRVGYFKIHYPEAFYAAIFSVKSIEFDYELMCKGQAIVLEEMKRIDALGQEATQKDEKTYVLLELVNEMYARGLKFAPLDLYKAQAYKFILTENGLMPPLCAIAGLGSSVAQLIASSRQDGEFYSIEDFKSRTKANKNVIELLKENGVLNGIPETDQLALF